MGQKRHTAEQIISKFRQVEVAQAQGATIAQAVKQIGVTEQSFYRWRKEYGGMRLDQAKRLKELEKESLLSEDVARSYSDKVQKLTDDTVAEIDRMLAAKEQEIMQV